MQDIEKVRESIRGIAGRPNSVTEREIEQIVGQLGQLGYAARSRPMGDHGTLFRVGTALPFSICTHHRGSKHLKACYVKSFLRTMIELGLYE